MLQKVQAQKDTLRSVLDTLLMTTSTDHNKVKDGATQTAEGEAYREILELLRKQGVLNPPGENPMLWM